MDSKSLEEILEKLNSADLAEEESAVEQPAPGAEGLVFEYQDNEEKSEPESVEEVKEEVASITEEKEVEALTSVEEPSGDVETEDSENNEESPVQEVPEITPFEAVQNTSPSEMPPADPSVMPAVCTPAADH